MNTYNIAMSYAKDRVQEVVPIVGQRLMTIQKFESAGEVFESVGYFDKAVEAFKACGKWDRALQAATQIRPMEIQKMVVDEIQR